MCCYIQAVFSESGEGTGYWLSVAYGSALYTFNVQTVMVTSTLRSRYYRLHFVYEKNWSCEKLSDLSKACDSAKRWRWDHICAYLAPRPGFPPLAQSSSLLTYGARQLFVVGGVPAVSLAFTHKMPVTTSPYPQVGISENVSRCCQMSSGRQNCWELLP